VSALPIGGEGGDTPRRGVPAENEAVPGGGAWRVRETTEPESSEFRSWMCVGVRVRVFRELELDVVFVVEGAKIGSSRKK